MRRPVEARRPVPARGHRARHALPALVLAAALTLTACGGADDDTADSPGATATSQPPTTTDTADAPSASEAPASTDASPATPTETATDSTPIPPPTATSEAPSTPSAGELASAKAGRGPVGVWRNRELQWVLRIKKNGRFVDDFAGVKNIRSGKWRLKGKKVILKGGDGVTTRGRLRSKTLTIKGTVLVRVR